MTLKIDRIFGEDGTRISLSGQLRSDQLEQLKTEIGRARQPMALDLEEVELADLESVRFLNECEQAGVTLIGCPAYIREWMLREHRRPKAQPDP